MLRGYGWLSVLLVFILFWSAPAVGEETCEELQARLDELTREAEGTSNLGELGRIQQELLDLSSRIMERCMSGGSAGGVVPPQMMNPEMMKRAATPEAEIKRQRDLMNIGWEQFNRNMRGKIDPTMDELAPIPRSVPLKGSIRINGQFESKPYRGWIWHQIKYTVSETFVGNLIIMTYYDFKTGRFTDKRDYMIQTLSTGISVDRVTGRKCIKASGGLPGRCIHWEKFNRFKISDGEIYPGFYAWTIKADSEPGEDIVEIEVSSPTVTFKSANGRATDGLGCFGLRENMTKAQFHSKFQQGRLTLSKDVGSPGEATPGCHPGSTIDLDIRFLGQ